MSLASGAACDPRPRPFPADPNGSDPPDGGGAIGKLYANDPSMAVWQQYGVPDRVVLGYTDESGLFDADEQTQRLVPKARRSANGVSYSSDYGKTWTRVGTIPPAPATCASPPCAIALAGAPALSENESVKTVDYVSLAYTRDDVAAPDAIATMSTLDLVHWSEPRVAIYIPGRPPSRPSFSRRASTSVVAFTDRVKGELFVATAEQDPPVFKIETPSVGRLADDDVYKDRPLVRLTSNAEGHIAYIIPRSEDGATFDLRIIHIWRTVDINGTSTPWNGSTIFVMNKITIDPTLPGALGRAWRDAYPFTFEVGDRGNHFYLAYRQRSTSTGQSEIYFFDCDARDGGNCAIEDAGQLTPGWRVRHFPPTSYTGGQFMPIVAADRYSTAASLAWFQETEPGSGSFTLMGLSTKDSGDHLTAPRDLRAGQGGAWSPCPTASTIAAGVHSYGEHSASIVAPWDPMVSAEPTFVTAHADSSYGCKDTGELTFDQHIGVTSW